MSWWLLGCQLVQWRDQSAPAAAQAACSANPSKPLSSPGLQGPSSPPVHPPVKSVIFSPLNWDKMISFAGWKPLNTSLGCLCTVSSERACHSLFGSNFNAPTESKYLRLFAVRWCRLWLSHEWEHRMYMNFNKRPWPLISLSPNWIIWATLSLI